ncbi:nucleotidyltransferase domain-containing protein [Homoserinibacter sp. GY 40078]|uniref:nucleotidyltransferase domain-containing protein n=1 Tax=Homoserinibacter sp. GY 40078 TaxID=2603275 RepID=UPI0011C8FA08|nr:nucleotidyltransferase domain-containing protein [Homoserinibacter sp. GY 40078]TXK18575.1 helix-turn-helix domain-containing protein [Homoserinibacter sp. GY 40078]
MLLTAPGADLLGSTEAAILRTLARLADPTSGRQIAKLSGGASPSSTHRYLRRLGEIGLVTATETSHATLFGLNRRHVYWGPLESLLASRVAFEKEIVDVARDEFDESVRVAVFGSVATSTAGPDSDLDVLLVLDDSVRIDDRLRGASAIADRIEEITGNEGQVIDVTETELRDLAARGSALVQEWEEHARPIDGLGPIPVLRSLP